MEFYGESHYVTQVMRLIQEENMDQLHDARETGMWACFVIQIKYKPWAQVEKKKKM